MQDAKLVKSENVYAPEYSEILCEVTKSAEDNHTAMFVCVNLVLPVFLAVGSVSSVLTGPPVRWCWVSE